MFGLVWLSQAIEMAIIKKHIIADNFSMSLF